MYVQTFRVRMHDTDAAGIIFFTSQLRMAHEAFESFLDSVGLGLGTLLAARAGAAGRHPGGSGDA
ncbi:MAG: hypothetical protein KJ726_01965 [Verrucomicrobia bacterium]|nr:hypothetical protein [Verrucomicrobiota bacterium]MBU1908794.1 hypothetical protein [Verrucomicrobiota bacterium]